MLLELYGNPERPMIGEAYLVNDVVPCSGKPAQPDPIQLELDDERLPCRAIVWDRSCKSSLSKKLNARANVFTLYGIEIPHYHRTVCCWSPSQAI
jgi:hypothetical protein